MQSTTLFLVGLATFTGPMLSAFLKYGWDDEAVVQYLADLTLPQRYMACACMFAGATLMTVSAMLPS